MKNSVRKNSVRTCSTLAACKLVTDDEEDEGELEWKKKKLINFQSD